MDICQICGSSNAQFHYGAVTCRACAAAFRRYVHSKKNSVHCKCEDEDTSRYACRKCRIKKCLDNGMKTELVQATRDSNRSKFPKIAKESDIIRNFTSCVEYPIALRNMDKLHRVQHNYRDLLNDRKLLKSSDKKGERINLYALSCMAMKDFDFASKMLEKAFPELNALGETENRKLYANFYPKWYAMEVAMFGTKSHEAWQLIAPSGEAMHSIENFYTIMKKDSELTKQDIIRIFSPYWTYFTDYFVPKITEQKMHNFEYMALLAIAFLDAGYPNLNEESAEICRVLKSIYLREFRAYYRENNFDDSDRRFFQILDVLQLIERAEAMNREEVQLCLIHNVEINEDYRKLLSASKC